MTESAALLALVNALARYTGWTCATPTEHPDGTVLVALHAPVQFRVGLEGELGAGDGVDRACLDLLRPDSALGTTP